MNEQWVDFSIEPLDVAGIIKTKQQAQRNRNSAKTIAELQRENESLRKALKQRDRMIGEQKSESRALMVTIRSFIDENILDRKATNVKLKKAREITLTELKKKGTKEYIKTASDFRV